MLLQIISSSSGDPVFHFKIPQLYPASVYDYYFMHSLSIEPLSTKHVHPMPTMYSNDIMQLCVDQINSLSLSRLVLRASHN